MARNLIYCICSLYPIIALFLVIRYDMSIIMILVLFGLNVYIINRIFRNKFKQLRKNSIGLMSSLGNVNDVSKNTIMNFAMLVLPIIVLAKNNGKLSISFESFGTTTEMYLNFTVLSIYLIVFIFLCIKSDSFYSFNPLLVMLGYSIYRVGTNPNAKGEVFIMYLVSKDDLSENDIVKTVKLVGNFYYAYKAFS